MGKRLTKLANKGKIELPPAPLPEPAFYNEDYSDYEDEGLNGIVPSGVMSTSQLMNMHFETVPLTGEFADFMQHPPVNMRIMWYGEPKNGKTSGAFQFAGELSKYGPVLYDLADQGFNPNTQQLIREFGLVENRNIGLSSTRSLDELSNQIREGNYQFVFIDMISNFKVTPEEMEHFMKAEHPNVGFVLVFASTKSGRFAGGQDWAHLVDVLIEVKKFVAYNTGRYGSGEFYIWPEKYPPNQTEEDDND